MIGFWLFRLLAFGWLPVSGPSLESQGTFRIKNVQSISRTWTLPELGMDSILGLELKQTLEMEFNVFLTPEDLRTMTFAKLWQLKDGNETNLVQKKVGKSSSHLLEFVLKDEFWNQPVLRIPFKDGKIQELLPIDENPAIFVFPRLEGLASTMEPLAKNLTWQTLCFQYHFVETDNFMPKLRDYFSSYILEKLQPEQEFYLIGYSMGSVVALEVAEILEKHGRKGHIWLIDASPKTTVMTSRIPLQEKKVSNEEEIQNRVCLGLLQTLMPELSKKMYDKQIEKTAGWDAKKKLCFSMLPHVEGIENHWHRIFDKLYKGFKTMPEYEISYFPLESSCVLIRCAKSSFGLQLDDSYGLTEHFKNPIEVHQIDGVGHYSILSHLQTSEIIMKSLPQLPKNNN